MTISRRLLITMIISAIATLFITILNVLQMDNVFREANFGNERVVPGIEFLDDALLEFGHIRVRIYRHALTEDVKAKDDLADAIAKSERLFLKALKDYEGLIHSSEDKQFLDEDARLFSAYMAGVRDTIALSRAGNRDETLRRLVDAVRAAENVNDALQKHMGLNKALGTQSSASALASKSFATWLSIAVSLASILIVAGLIMHIRRGVTTQLDAANVMADAIASGNLSPNGAVARASNDEVGTLLRSMEKMRTDLATTVRTIVTNGDEITASAAHLSTAAQQVSASTNHQSTSTASAAAAVEELTVSIDHVATNCDDARQEAFSAGEMAQESGKGAITAAEKTTLVANYVDQTSQQIQNLSNRVQEIGTITTVIRDVADQTNLLALNAAIEAARAGEQGRGFAVVADEVRKLAERTTTSAQEISEVISSIQGGVASAVHSMHESREQVAEVVASAQSASASMNEIESITKKVCDAINGISEAMREQRSASGELSRNVESVAQMSDENSAAVASVASTAKRLEEVSAAMKTAISRFAL